jgi:hypothetical protein
MKHNKAISRARRPASLKSRLDELPRSKRLAIKGILLPIALAAVVSGVFFCAYKTYRKLLDICNSQSVVIDETEQIKIHATPHFSEANIRESFGLKNGCNLAMIDFRAKREQILKKRPLLSDITITRNLTRKSVTITAEERRPVARINYKRNGAGRESWLVVDLDGVVFDYSLNDSQMLPVIKESAASAEKGEKISGKALWGLRLTELCTSRELSGLHLSEIDVSNDIYLIARTRDYSSIKLLWSYITEHGTHNTGNMRDALMKIRDIINTDLKVGHYQTFIVTGKNRVTVSPNDKEYSR